MKYFLGQTDSDCGPITCMATEIIVFDDLNVIRNLRYSQAMILKLRQHHRNPVTKNEFCKRVSCNITDSRITITYNDDDLYLIDDVIENDIPVAGQKRFNSSVHAKPHSTPKKRNEHCILNQ